MLCKETDVRSINKQITKQIDCVLIDPGLTNCRSAFVKDFQAVIAPKTGYFSCTWLVVVFTGLVSLSVCVCVFGCGWVGFCVCNCWSLCPFTQSLKGSCVPDTPRGLRKCQNKCLVPQRAGPRLVEMHHVCPHQRNMAFWEADLKPTLRASEVSEHKQMLFELEWIWVYHSGVPVSLRWSLFISFHPESSSR